MDAPHDLDAVGPFDARYLAFLETISQLRPKLHRYCSRMSGSVLDGEDVVQEALFQAYRSLESFDADRPLAPWLFRIAHNRCIDLLRRREARQEAEAEATVPDLVEPVEATGRALGRAVEHLVLALPPKERACVLLKDVFDYSLDEIAELVDSTVGGVKAALARGRAKLAGQPPSARRPADTEVSRASRTPNAELSRLLHLYVDRFNQRDWDGLRELIAADARLRVADRFAGRLDESPYFGRYESWSFAWRLAVGELDGEPVIVFERQDAGDWIARAPIRLDVEHGRVTRIADYNHCPWILPLAGSVLVSER